MKKIFLLLILLFLCSCKTVITSPATHIEYTGEISKKGISVTAKPPFWQLCINAYKYLVKD